MGIFKLILVSWNYNIQSSFRLIQVSVHCHETVKLLFHQHQRVYTGFFKRALTSFPLPAGAAARPGFTSRMRRKQFEPFGPITTEKLHD